MKNKYVLLAPIVGLVFIFALFSLNTRTIANTPSIKQGDIQPQASNPFFTLTVTSAPSPVTVGSVVNYTIQLVHQPFGRIVVSSNVPQNSVFCPGSDTASTAGWAFSAPAGGTGPFNWTNNSLPPGTTTTVFTFSVL